MKAVWKYALNPVTQVEVPEGAIVLSVQVQDNQPQIWMLVDPGKAAETRVFKSFGTGHEFDDAGLVYVGTFQINNGALVFHAFEELR